MQIDNYVKQTKELNKMIEKANEKYEILQGKYLK